MLTAQDFVEAPDSCPSCGDRISVDVDNDDEGFCHECGFEWKVERRFVGYSYEDEDGHHTVEIPDPAEECARLQEQVRLLREALKGWLEPIDQPPEAYVPAMRDLIITSRSAIEATKEGN